MKDRRGKISLLLFLLINLTACQTWKPVSVGAVRSAQLIIEDQPDRVRVVFLEGTGQTPLEIESPSVDGDELVGRLGATMFRVPLADIDHLAVNELRVLMPALAIVGAFYGSMFVIGALGIMDPGAPR
jgi:hypothetical protein